jgi:deoxyxylulose-5-phosphate synthase
VLELLSEKQLQLPISTLGIPDRFFDHASQQSLRTQAGLVLDDLLAAAHDVLGRKPEAVGAAGAGAGAGTNVRHIARVS